MDSYVLFVRIGNKTKVYGPETLDEITKFAKDLVDDGYSVTMHMLSPVEREETT